MLTTSEAIKKRRSIRKYKPEPVADDILKSLLDASRLAPSGCNAQPRRFRIVDSHCRDASLSMGSGRYKENAFEYI